MHLLCKGANIVCAAVYTTREKVDSTSRVPGNCHTDVMQDALDRKKGSTGRNREAWRKCGHPHHLRRDTRKPALQQTAIMARTLVFS